VFDKFVTLKSDAQLHFYCRSPTSLLDNPRATLRHHQMAFIYEFFTLFQRLM